VNHLASAGEDRWQLPRHAHLVVHEREDGGLLTIYDCGAAQKPPSAQLLGRLVRVAAEHEQLPQPDGYILKLRQEATLERQADDRWVVRG